jgi:AcrR family transcriptional regulator
LELILVIHESVDKRKKVLNTALKMILENGTQGASMGKISKQSGVAVGTIYHHFSSKEELITELYKELKLKMLQAIKYVSQEETPYQSFYTMIKKFIEYALNYPDEYEFIERYCNSPIIDNNVKKEIEASFKDTIDDFLTFIKSKKFIKEIPEDLLFLYINGALSGFLRAQISGEIKLEKKFVDLYIRMIWEGLTK